MKHMIQTIAFLKKSILNSYSDDDIKKNVDDNLTLVDTDSDALIATIIDLLKTPKEVLLDTEIFRETNGYVYQMCHIPIVISEIPNMDNLNSIATCLMTEPIFGDCVLIKSKVLPDNTCAPANFTNNDVQNLLYRGCRFKAVVVSDLNTFEEKEFHIDPTTIISNTLAPIEINQFGYSLLMYVDINFQDKAINKTGSRIAGEFFVCGDVMLVQRFRNGFTDITLQEVRALEEVSWITEPNRGCVVEKNKKAEDMYKIEPNTKKKIVHNRFTVVKNLLKEIKNNPPDKDWDKFFNSFRRKSPINEYALQQSMRGEPTVNVANNNV